MKIGKVSQSIYERSVLKQFHKDQIENQKSAGKDCAFFCASETFSLNSEEVAALTISMAANDLIAQGGTPRQVSINLILTTRQSEAFLKKVMAAASAAMAIYDIILSACSVEVVDAVMAPIACVSVFGAGVASFPGATSGQDVVMSKWIGLGATAIIATIKEEELLLKYPKHLLEKAKSFSAELSVLPEAALAVKSGVSAMCHVNKGGVFGALWEMADKAGVGLIIDLKKIPVKQETIEISEVYDSNPYELLGCGSLLMVTDDGHDLVRKLNLEGISAKVIGKTTDNNDRILLNEGESRFLEPTKPDEIIKILAM